jgi:hypothetical protein
MISLETNPRKGILFLVIGLLLFALNICSCFFVMSPSWLYIELTGTISFASSILILLLFAISGIYILPPRSKGGCAFIRQIPSLFVVTAITLHLAGYLLAMAVLNALLGICGLHYYKYGDFEVSLGKATAINLLGFVVTLLSCLFAVYFFSHGKKWSSLLSRAAIGMILFTGLIYLVLAMSPLVSWRA